MCTFAKVASAAHDKNHNSLSACGGKMAISVSLNWKQNTWERFSCHFELTRQDKQGFHFFVDLVCKYIVCITVLFACPGPCTLCKLGKMLGGLLSLFCCDVNVAKFCCKVMIVSIFSYTTFRSVVITWILWRHKQAFPNTQSIDLE